MLQLTRRHSLRLQTLGLRCASGKVPQPYEEFKKMMADSKKQYPGFFPDQKTDFDNQSKLIDATWESKSLQSNCEAYNAAYQNLWDNYGLDKFEWGRYERAPRLLKTVFKTLDFDYISTMKPAPQKLPMEDWAHMDRKMELGQQMLQELAAITPTDPNDIYNVKAREDPKKNLEFVARDKLKGELKEWLLRILSDDDSNRTMSGLPFDEVMMGDIYLQVRHDKMRDGFWQKTAAEKDAISDEVVQEVWDRMYDQVVAHTQPNRTKEEFNDLRKVYWEMFHPKDIEHYKFNKVSKLLFLQAYWKGGEKLVKEVDHQVNLVREIYQNTPADILELWKQAMVDSPDSPIASEVALFVKALDTAFLPKIISNIRSEYCGAQLIRTGHKVLQEVFEDDLEIRMQWFKRELAELPETDESMNKLREELPDFADKVDDVIFRQKVIEKQKAAILGDHERKMDIPLPSFEDMVKHIVREHLWVAKGANDERAQKVDAFAVKLLGACKKSKIDIVALDAEAKSLFPNTLASESNPVDDKGYLKTFINYTRSSRNRMDLWTFKDFFQHEVKAREMLNTKRGAMMGYLDGFDSTVVTMMKHMVETQNIQLERTLDNYNSLVKRFNGEVYGTITSATPLTDSQFKQLQDALQKQNPGKTFILSSQVEPSLLAGFIVKCGTQKLDYSLSSQTNALRKFLSS